MDRLYILCLEDQREVLNTILEELEVFEEYCILEGSETAEEARDLLEDISREGDHLAVVVSDHIMPGQTGVDFLVDLKEDGRFRRTRTLLLTGLATHQDTIRAINEAGIDRYLEKPWQPEILVRYVKELLTLYILDTGLDYQDFLSVLDQPTLLERLRT